MSTIQNFFKEEPVRAFEALAAALALIAIFVPAVPVAAVLAVIVPLLGAGETVRSHVTPTHNVLIDRRDV